MCKFKFRFLIALLTFGIGVSGVYFLVVKSRTLETLVTEKPVAPKKEFSSSPITSSQSSKESLPCIVSRGGDTKVDVAKVKELLSSGVDVDSTADSCIMMEPSPRGVTLLMNSAWDDDREAAKLLLENRANANAMNSYRETPLSYAIRGQHLEIIRLLVENGADVNARGEYDDTPLMSAAGSGNIEVIEYLLDRGADINAKDEHKVTALLYAAARKQPEAMKLLVERGADPNPKDKAGRTIAVYLKKGFPDEYINWRR